MKMTDIERLRGSAIKTTHLIRYETANDKGADSVLAIACLHCGAAPGAQCKRG